MILTIKFERKDKVVTLKRNFKVHFHWDRDEMMLYCYVMDLWVIYSFCFGPCDSYKGVCDIKLFKISTAYVVLSSTFSNLMLAMDSALVLVFINFLWAVYVFLWHEIMITDLIGTKMISARFPFCAKILWGIVPKSGWCRWITCLKYPSGTQIKFE